MHREHDDEPVPGLPERPPEGERILWQGRPDWRALTREAFLVRWVLGYFALIAAWRFLTLVDRVPLGLAVRAGAAFLILGALAAALLALIGWVQARATLYTLTDRRVAMRIGAALTITLNLPFRQIASAEMALRPDGTGTVVLVPLPGTMPFGRIMLWPHARPWTLRAEPALRCIPDAERVARLLADAAETRLAEPVVSGPMAVAAE